MVNEGVPGFIECGIVEVLRLECRFIDDAVARIIALNDMLLGELHSFFSPFSSSHSSCLVQFWSQMIAGCESQTRELHPGIRLTVLAQCRACGALLSRSRA